MMNNRGPEHCTDALFGGCGIVRVGGIEHRDD
jgi:hypothetical protein